MTEGGGGDDLVAKQKEFLESFFKKATEFTEELLRENEKLRFRVVQLEEQMASSARAIPTPATLKELVEKLHHLEHERQTLLDRFASVEAENREYLTRYHEIERENNNLAALYVAVHQLHSTFELREVLQTIEEILLNFVGAKVFSLLLLDEETRELRPVSVEGVPREDVVPRKLGAGVIGRTGETGVAHYEKVPRSGPVSGRDEPAICIPLRIARGGDKVVGVVAIWDFLQQKTELAEVDYEIFTLLGSHAASALEAARLAAESPGGGRLQFTALTNLLGGGR
jgi:hypothetical protein